MCSALFPPPFSLGTCLYEDYILVSVFGTTYRATQRLGWILQVANAEFIPHHVANGIVCPADDSSEIDRPKINNFLYHLRVGEVFYLKRWVLVLNFRLQNYVPKCHRYRYISHVAY